MWPPFIKQNIHMKHASSAKNAPIVNHEGAPAFERSLKEQVLQVLSTNTLSDTFYVSKEAIRQKTFEVIREAREKDHHFLAQAIVWARQHGLMKLVPITALAILSGKRGLAPAVFRNTFLGTILTPDDLRTFVACIKESKISDRKGLGGMVRDIVRDWIVGISEYHTIKYGSVRSKEITLRDIIRMVHPKALSDAHNERLGWLVKGSLGSNAEHNPQLHVYQALKRAQSQEEIVALVRQGKLPFEVVVPSVTEMTKEVWAELLQHAPYFNLLRSLNTFKRHGVFEEEKNIECAVSKLINPSAVKHSRVLPFRFLDALQAFCSNDPRDARIMDAIREALEHSFVNLPDFGQETHVTCGIDVSYSMNRQISDKGKTRYIDIAGIFAGALLKRAPKALALPFEGYVVDMTLSRHESIAHIAEKLASIGGGSTAVGAPIEYLLNHKIKTDVFIGITDNEDWAYGDGYSTSGSFLTLWRRYRKEINPNALAFLVTIAPYRHAVAPTGEKGIHFIYGWSEQVLQFISLKLNTGESQVSTIEKIKL